MKKMQYLYHSRVCFCKTSMISNNTKIYFTFEIKFNQLIVESQIPGFNPRNVFYDVVSNNLNSTCKHCMGYYITHT